MKKYLVFLFLILISCQKDELEPIGGIEREDMIFAVSESKVVDGQTIFFNILSEEEHTLIVFDEETQSVVAKETFQPKVGLFDRTIYTKSLPKKRLQLILQTTEELEKTYINVDWYIYRSMFVFTHENIGNIKNAVYSTDGMKDKHAEKIEYSKTKGIFKDFNYDKYKIQKPPKNASIQVYNELMYLRDLPDDLSYVKEHDDIEKVFENICKEHNLKYPKDLVKELIKSSAGIILDLKWKNNRPRPYQLAQYYNEKIGGNVLESMKTPSFPSGHSTQGFLVGKVLQTKLPITTDAFLEAGKRISYSRNVGRAHFPSDSKMGEELGSALYQYIKQKL